VSSKYKNEWCYDLSKSRSILSEIISQNAISTDTIHEIEEENLSRIIVAIMIIAAAVYLTYLLPNKVIIIPIKSCIVIHYSLRLNFRDISVFGMLLIFAKN
jgi:hypothetical protein